MAYTKLIYHIVWRVKEGSYPISPAHDRELYAYIYGYCNNHGCKVYRINGMPDHIHILLSVPPTIAIADFMHDLKISSSNFMKNRRDLFPEFIGWAASYGVFTVSESQRDTVYHYILGQKEHHKEVSFREEYMEFLKENGVDYDERYIK